jgi:hypothetical protein
MIILFTKDNVTVTMVTFDTKVTEVPMVTVVTRMTTFTNIRMDTMVTFVKKVTNLPMVTAARDNKRTRSVTIRGHFLICQMYRVTEHRRTATLLQIGDSQTPSLQYQRS